MGTVNVLFIYGAGNDTAFGGGLRWLQSEVKVVHGSKVYLPRIVDWTEYNTIVRLLKQWKDPTIIVGHSCGCKSATDAAAELSMEPIPFLMAIAPSIFCPLSPLPPNVKRAAQASSWAIDMFNPFSRQLLTASPVNKTTKVDIISTGKAHLSAPYHDLVRARLLDEVNKALLGL